MKNNFKIVIVALFAASFSFSSCENDINEFESEKKQSSTTDNLENNPLVIDGKKNGMEFFSKTKKTDKGYVS